MRPPPEWTDLERPPYYDPRVPSDRKPSAVGRNLARIRTAKRPRISQAKLAEKAGVARSTIANLESGFTGNPNYEIVRALADALEVDILALYAGASGTALLDPLVDALLALPLGAQLRPTDEEIVWLRSLGALDFGGVSPTPETLYFMVLGRRAGSK